VHHVQRQQRDTCSGDVTLAPIQVVADGATVQQHQRPRLVHVRRVDVTVEAGVQHLSDAR